MVIEWSNQGDAFWCCIIENKIKIYPKLKILMIGKIENQAVYNSLKEAWFEDTTLIKYRFPVSVSYDCSLYVLEGWEILREKEK